MEKAKKRSPLKEKPLRNPGQYLEEKVYDIVYSEIFGNAVLMIVLLSFTISEWLRYYLHTPPNPILLTVITLLAFLPILYRIYSSLKNADKYKLGRDGEKYVGQFLEGARAKGYLVFHDIYTGKGNIDHILIGPGGVFTIETKTRSKADGDQRIVFDGKSIVEGNTMPTTRPIIQANGEAFWLQSYIKEKSGIALHIHPVVLYPGWYVVSPVQNSNIWVLNEKYFLKKLDSEPVRLNEKEVSEIERCLKILLF